jgi:hypothetical protein
MDERMSVERLESALRSLHLAYPEAPDLRSVVVGRLQTDRAARRRPPLPGAVLWSRRRVLVLVAVGLLAVLAIAAAARYAIGAFEVRVQPGASSGTSAPPFEPNVLGEPVPPDVAAALAGFEASLPTGPPPEEIYVVDTPFGDPGLVFAWRPSAAYAAIEGTDWGLVLIAAQGDAELTVKTIDRFEDLDAIRVDGREAFWIAVPHALTFETERGSQTYSVRANVLIWQEGDGISYRLETSLGRAAAVALAESLD